jgi:uncharacterized MAPEG superfamily protein
LTPSLLALLGFLSWTLVLLILMEVLRTRLVLTGAVPANGFDPGNSNLSPFMQRLARAHANCLEGLPVFGGLLLIAVVSGRSQVTDPLAWLLLGARLVQSLIHLASTSSPAVSARFTAFALQVGIAAYWAIRTGTASRSRRTGLDDAPPRQGT